MSNLYSINLLDFVCILTIYLLSSLNRAIDFTSDFIFVIFVTHIISIVDRIYVVTGGAGECAIHIAIHNYLSVVMYNILLYYLQNVGMLFVLVYDLYFWKQFILSNCDVVYFV